MTAAKRRKFSRTALARMQEHFVKELPLIEKVARFRLRRLGEEEKLEAIAETIAMSWEGYCHLCEQGRDPGPLIQKIAEFCAKGYLVGRRFASTEHTWDPLSAVYRHRHPDGVQSLSSADDGEMSPDVAALHDRKAFSPADQAVFRADFHAWLDTLDDKHRSFAEDLAAGQNTISTAKARGVSRGTTSNMRRHLNESWNSVER